MKKLRVTVDGKVYEVTVEMADEAAAASVTKPPPPAAAPAAVAPAPAPAAPPSGAAPAGAVVSPLAGKVVSIDVPVGAAIAVGAQLATIEAMKMNTFVYADRAGTVRSIQAKPGDAVEEGAALLVVG